MGYWLNFRDGEGNSQDEKPFDISEFLKKCERLALQNRDIYLDVIEKGTKIVDAHVIDKIVMDELLARDDLTTRRKYKKIIAEFEHYNEYERIKLSPD